MRGSLQSQEEAILGNSTPTGADTTGGQAVVTGEGVTRPHTHTHTHGPFLPSSGVWKSTRRWPHPVHGAADASQPGWVGGICRPSPSAADPGSPSHSGPSPGRHGLHRAKGPGHGRAPGGGPSLPGHGRAPGGGASLPGHGRAPGGGPSLPGHGVHPGVGPLPGLPLGRLAVLCLDLCRAALPRTAPPSETKGPARLNLLHTRGPCTQTGTPSLRGTRTSRAREPGRRRAALRHRRAGSSGLGAQPRQLAEGAGGGAAGWRRTRLMVPGAPQCSPATWTR